jgi:hypothetical protein
LNHLAGTSDKMVLDLSVIPNQVDGSLALPTTFAAITNLMRRLAARGYDAPRAHAGSVSTPKPMDRIAIGASGHAIAVVPVAFAVP